MLIVCRRDFDELKTSDPFWIMLALFAAITAGGSIAACIALGRQPWLTVAAARPLLELIVALIVYFLPMFILVSFIWAFTSLPITKEKVNGNIECLLATPLGARDIWMGKCLAVFLPACVVALSATVIVLLAVNLVTVIPATGVPVFPLAPLLTGLVVIPLLFFGLLAVIVFLSLTGDPDAAIAPSFLVGFGLMLGIPLGMAFEVVDPTCWAFALWHLAGTAVLWVVVYFFSRLLVVERMILSPNG